MTKYNFGAIPYEYALTECDSNKILNPRISKTDYVFSYKGENTPPLIESAFLSKYEYDSLGRLKKNHSRTYSGYTYDYGTGADFGKINRFRYNNYANTVSPSTSELDPDVSLEDIVYLEDERIGRVQSYISYRDLSDKKNRIERSVTIDKDYYLDSSHRLKIDFLTKTKDETTIETRNDFVYFADGRLKSITHNMWSIKDFEITQLTKDSIRNFSYDAKGRLSSVSQGSRYTPYTYDRYGNRTSKVEVGESTRYTYKYGNNLTKIVNPNGTHTYEYNLEGQRTQKITNGKQTRYILKGNRIIGEITGNETIYYIYDIVGLKGFYKVLSNKDTLEDKCETYIYVRDSQNNIVMITDIAKRVVARYEYDVFGNCTVYDEQDKANRDPKFLGNLNPFRWKSLYYDTETGLYYANGSYYDTETVSYVNASPVSSAINGTFVPGRLDRNGIMCDNVTELRKTEISGKQNNGIVVPYSKVMLQALPMWTEHVSKGIDVFSSVTPALERAVWGLTKTGRAFTEIHYAMYGLNGYELLSELRSPLGEICKGIAIGLIALDLGFNIYNSFQQGYTFEQAALSLALTAAKDVGLYFLVPAVTNLVGAKLGMIIGGTAGGPVGMIFGTMIGIAVGLIIDWVLSEVIDIIVNS